MGSISFFSVSRLLVALGVLLAFLSASLFFRAEDKDHLPTGAATQAAANYSTPKETFKAFLSGLKANDLTAAKRCWFISDDNAAGVLDVLIGEWISDHRLAGLAQSKFTAQGRDLLERELLEELAYGDEAIDRTLARLDNARVELSGEIARLSIPWPEDSRSERKPAFLHRWDRPFDWKFRRIKGDWKLDAHWETGFQRPTDFFEPAGWIYFNPGTSALKKQLIADIESGKLRTAEQTVSAFEARWKPLATKVEAERQKKPLDPVQARFFAAWNITLRFRREFHTGWENMWGLYRWSLRLMEAERARGGNEAERIGAAEAHLERMIDAQYSARQSVAAGNASTDSYLAGDNYRSEAEILLAEAKAKTAEKTNPLEAAATFQASAELIYDYWWEEFESKDEPRSLSLLAYWSARRLEAQTVLQAEKAYRLPLAETHLGRMREVEKIVRDRVNSKKLTMHDLSQATFFRANAEICVAECKDTGSREKEAFTEAARVQLEAAKAAYEGFWASFPKGGTEIELVYEWSNHLRNAATALATTKSQRVSAAEAHLARMKRLQKPVKEWVEAGRAPTFELWVTDFFIAEAEILLAGLGTSGNKNGKLIPPEGDTWQRDVRVEECERQVARKECELAEARARLALAQGKQDVAIREQRKAIAYYKARLQWLRDHIGRLCYPDSEIKPAELDLAEATAWLADVEGKTDTRVSELKKIVRYHQWHVRTMRLLLEKKAALPEELREAQDNLQKSQDRLKAAIKVDSP